LLVGDQGHWPDLSGPVAGLAARLKDRQDVFSKRRARLRRPGARKRRQEDKHVEQVDFRTQYHQT